MKTINGAVFYGMLVSAANGLDNKKEIINNMNVFPVPDGDTGINMTLTLRTVRGLSDYDGTLSDCAKHAAAVVLRAARGNSGAILSLFFRGMSKAFRGLDEAGPEDIANAFCVGHEEAYRAVMNPTQGTILTVMQCAGERARELTEGGKFTGTVEQLFDQIVEAAEIALAKTPEQLPKLKEAQVVDAGGYGFVTILKGMVAALKKRPVTLLHEEEEVTLRSADFGRYDAEEITFSYCTECIVDKAKEYLGEGKVDALRQFVMGIGDSVVFVDDESVIKLHVHTDHPGKVMEEALKFGALATVKIENMRIQHSEMAGGMAPAKPEEPKVAKPEKKYGFVSVCLGEGIASAFRDVGVDRIIHGGQTMNPSTQDIIDAVNGTPAEVVYVLPNNKNIYMVAEQASKLIKDKQVVVIPTKSVPQGISAMIAFNPDGSVEENTAEMEKAIGHVVSMSVTGAVRSTTVQGEKITNGQMLGLVDGAISCVADSAEDCLKKLSETMTNASYIMVFCGEGVDEEEQAKAEAILRQNAPDCELVMLPGGQPLYPFILSVE